MAGDRVQNGTKLAGVLGVALALGACGSSSNMFSGSALDVFSSSSKATTANASAEGGAAAQSEINCPDVTIRSGASTMTIGTKPGDAEPSALDVRYQGSITRTARECHVAAGVMTMKVGIEGRIITGPAGGPGTVDVPLRLAIVQEGVSPKPIVSKFARVQVTVTNAVDRVSFTHIDSEISFPMPTPAGLIDSYVVYVGFDPVGAPPPKKPPAKRPAKPRQS